jgi:hypothetical protein
MRLNSGLCFLASLGLVVGCGDDGNNTTATTTSPMTMTSITTLTTGSTDNSGSGSDSSSTSPTTTEGTGSATGSTTESPTSGDPSGTTETTGPVSSTDPMTSTMSTMTTMTGTGGTPCEEIMATVKPITPNAMLVLDKSGSMLQTWDHDANANTPVVTRWYSLWAVANQVLTDFNEAFNFGMNLYPSTAAQQKYDNTACPVNMNVEVPVAPLNKDPIIAALPAQANMTIKGGTPAAAGMTAALNHLKSLDPNVPRVIMLITDGAANCSSDAANNNDLFEVYDANLPEIVGNAWTVDKIPVYVIGIATVNAVTPVMQDGNPNGINPYEKLNELATLGGTAKPGPEQFYNADNQIELAAALNEIVKSAQSCIIPLDSEPVFPNDTVVKVGGMTLPKITDCANESGWKYTDPNPPYTGIEVCGAACDDLKLAGMADVEYYCSAG